MHPGVDQLTIVDAEPGTEFTVSVGPPQRRRHRRPPAPSTSSASLLFRDLDEQTKYFLSTEDGVTASPYSRSAATTTPTQDFYAAQALPAPRLRLHRDPRRHDAQRQRRAARPAEEGPYPTVVEYSRLRPEQPGRVGLRELFTALGYAYVGVNMRGTGCSGGSFDFFEYAQSLDGYDAIEAVAAQPWVLDNEVGMVGISYPGISQLFVAQTQPPNLTAITPLSVIDDTFRGTLYPGGILNTGFAVDWAQDRADRESAPYGQEWAADRIDAGDTTCAENQELRLQNPTSSR